jgi:hypothetical protein
MARNPKRKEMKSSGPLGEFGPELKDLLKSPSRSEIESTEIHLGREREGKRKGRSEWNEMMNPHR